MPKFLIVIIIVVVVGLLVWFFYPRAQVVRLIVCPGAANNEPDLDFEDKDVVVRWSHLFGTKVKFKNESLYDGVHIKIDCTNFFKNPQSELDFTLAIGESKTLTLRRDLPSGEICDYEVDPYCKLPGPRLIKRP